MGGPPSRKLHARACGKEHGSSMMVVGASDGDDIPWTVNSGAGSGLRGKTGTGDDEGGSEIFWLELRVRREELKEGQRRVVPWTSRQVTLSLVCFRFLVFYSLLC
ncbi:hypothetical protein PVL29_001192 [Vitis rotundifolia]|uniref:Uncharacterized protein n=1 Tax=Vitis rotundifolia TaxID=103349 RepID=A0AA39AL79_VITRO|nr:hypothetical protein PVL29_001192 [Vitis rotundifolia]